MTTIQDTITHFDGSAASGEIVVTCPPFQYAGVAVAAGQKRYTIGANGSITITCYPSVGGIYFTATYQLDQGAVTTEYWSVPDTSNIITIGAVRVNLSEAQPGM